jgi:inosine/xanthosine triphosphatase
VASSNPVKVEAALAGFRRLFPEERFEVAAVSVPSGVSAQPMSDEETMRGARHRAEGAVRQVPDADYWVGIEGGIEERDGALEAFAWIVVQSREGLVGRSRTATFLLPERVAAHVRRGVELGEADDLVFDRTNSKQQNGAVGLFTDDVIDRKRYYEHAVILALIPFKKPDVFAEPG